MTASAIRAVINELTVRFPSLGKHSRGLHAPARQNTALLGVSTSLPYDPGQGPLLVIKRGRSGLLIQSRRRGATTKGLRSEAVVPSTRVEYSAQRTYSSVLGNFRAESAPTAQQDDGRLQRRG